MSDARSRPLDIWFAPPIALAIGAAIILVGPWILQPLASRMSEAGFATVTSILLYGAFAAAGLAAGYVQQQKVLRAGGRPWLGASLGAAIGISGLILTSAIVRLAGGLELVASVRGSILSLLLGTAVVLFQSAGEEVYLRGWLQPVLMRRLPDFAAISISATVFTMLHVFGGWREPMSLINLWLGGILFGLLAVRSGGIAVPVLAHFGWNWAEQILLGLDTNPGVGPFGSFLDLELHGNSLWTNSVEGLNSTLAMAFVLVALILPVAAWRPGQESVKAHRMPPPMIRPNRHAWLLGEE